MALIKFFEDPLDYLRPSMLSNQRFGLSLDDNDLLSATIVPRRLRRLLSPPYFRNWSSRESTSDQGSIVACDKNGFRVNLDVQQFAPEEITVKATGDKTITIEGKHEEKKDEHGLISRHFVRKYTLPEGHDINKIVSKLSSDGVLTITAPKIESEEEEGRIIPIQQTGQPSEASQKRKSDPEENGGVSQMDINEKESPKKKKKSN